ncbi:hypothetical protein DPMN_140067 [Dreissena polymorpha]|uniref:Uncharacterized protein n=1 Tax=Dreissena polymorpha TaxID=45954 RepID=A0A9D4JH28_DREPO|nr:hypothetical protein DPMN_140067 [Dreissena polymorpha]
MEVTTKKSKIMVNSIKKHQWRYQHEWRKARRGDQLLVLGSNPVPGCHQYSYGPSKSCHGDGSDSQSEQIVNKQLNQLPS